jgi:hypothetical protein
MGQASIIFSLAVFQSGSLISQSREKMIQNPLSVKWNLIMVAMQDLQTVEIGDTPSFRQILAARINRLQTRETLSLELQALLFLSMNRREAFAWLKARNCYVRFVQKKRVIELRKM